MELNLVIYDLQKLDGRSGTVYSVCFSPDGNTLASGSSDNSIVYGMLKQDNKFNPRIKVIQRNFGKMQDLPFIKQPFYSYSQYYHSLHITNGNFFYLKELLSLRESLQIIKASIQDFYQNQKEVAFQKAYCKNER